MKKLWKKLLAVTAVSLTMSLILLTLFILPLPVQASTVHWSRPSGEIPPIDCEVQVTETIWLGAWKRIEVYYWIPSDPGGRLRYACALTSNPEKNWYFACRKDFSSGNGKKYQMHGIDILEKLEWLPISTSQGGVCAQLYQQLSIWGESIE